MPTVSFWSNSVIMPESRPVRHWLMPKKLLMTVK